MRKEIQSLGLLVVWGILFCGFAQATTIDFDNVQAPSLFSETTHLTELYSPLGVHFSGPPTAVPTAPAKDGGAILNQLSDFGVNAYSGPNFLAFNREGVAALMSDGGIPKDPETILFDAPVSSVSIYAAGGNSSDTFTLAAYNAGNFLVATNSITTQDWGLLSVLAPGITKVILTQVGDETFVYDNLSFNGGGSAVPEPMTIILLGSGLAGVIVCRRGRNHR
jgi:hypothetical protein